MACHSASTPFGGVSEGLDSVGMGLDRVRIVRKGLLDRLLSDWIPEGQKGL
jgi:hypothetical protein